MSGLIISTFLVYNFYIGKYSKNIKIRLNSLHYFLFVVFFFTNKTNDFSKWLYKYVLNLFIIIFFNFKVK